MPSVINGIGTWYYGKRNIHRFRAGCEFCNRVGDLESYDTTLYFVVVFIPVIPIGKKRILSIHYAARSDTSLKVWNFRVISDLNSSACWVGTPSKVVSIAARNDAKFA